MKTVNLIGKILNFSILTLVTLWAGLKCLGHFIYVRSDANDLLVIAIFLMLISWVVNAIRCCANSDGTGASLPKLTHALTKRGVAWLGGALLVLLSGWGVYAVCDYNKPTWRWNINERWEETWTRHSYYKLVDKTTNKAVLKGCTRFVAPEGNDSLLLFFKDDKRGFFNLNTGEIVVPATTYTHAWMFYEGLAAVEKDGKIGFINPQGEVVIDFLFDYDKSILSAFGFRHGRCLVLGENKKKGIVDHQGNWLIQLEYDYISMTPDYVVVGKKGELKKMVDYEGNVLQENIFDSSRDLRYERYCKNEDGDASSEYVYVKGICVYEVDGLEGLITDEAHIITPPLYYNIEAHDDQHFKATLQDGSSEVWLNRKGEVINNITQ